MSRVRVKEMGVGKHKALVVGNAPGGNYEAETLRIGERYAGKPGLHHVYIYHDDWCGVFFGRECDCEPIVTETPL